MSPYRGFTLIELLLTLLILGIALAVAIPSLKDTVAFTSVVSDSKTVLRMVNQARSEALNRGLRVNICPLNSDSKCTRSWPGDITMFVDSNRDGYAGSTETVLRRWRVENQHSEISWSGFGSGYLRYEPTGLAVENGSFTLCPEDGNNDYARQVVINRVGRSYLSRDYDGDGIVEYGRNKEPQC
ncbi:MAG: GspH/FimT family protein [Pseudomonadales bacterium]